MARICFIAYGLNRANIGLQPWRYLIELARGIQFYGNELILIGEEDFQIQNPIGNSFLQVISRNKKKSYFRIADGVIIKINSIKPDLVVMGFGPSSIVYWSILRRINVPFIGILLSTPPRIIEVIRTKNSWIMEDLLKPIALLIDAAIPRGLVRRFLDNPRFLQFIVLSSASQNWLLSLGIDPQKISLLPPGKDKVTRFNGASELRKKLNIPNDCITICYVGSPAFVRGPDILLKAFRKFSDSESRVRLLMILRESEAPKKLSKYTKMLRGISRHLQIEEKVIFITENLDRKSFLAMMGGCDAAVFPFKIIEAECPLSVMEAIEEGVLVVASRNDGIPDIVRGRRAILIQPEERDLRNGLIEITKMMKKNDSTKSNQSTEYLEFPTWEEVSLKFQKLVEEVTQGEWCQETMEST